MMLRLIVAVLLAAGVAWTAFQDDPPDAVTVAPDRGVAGAYGTWTVTVKVPEGGIARGGAIRVQLPDSWHAGDRNSANPLQASDPKADHYIASRSSREGVTLKTIVESESRRTLIKSPRLGIDGRYERYVYVVRVEVAEGRLEQGDTVSVVYGDTSGGSRGMRAAVISTGPEPVLVAVDARGTGKFALLDARPTLRATGGPAAELLLTGPSTLVVGKPAFLRAAYVDANANPAGEVEKRAVLHRIEGSAEAPDAFTFQDGPWTEVRIVPSKPGILRFKAASASGRFQAIGNPMRVHAKEPDLKIYWGDLHSHTKYSWDGVGGDNFEYARRVSGLDFYAMSDHSIAPTRGRPRGLAEHTWGEYTAKTDKYHDPGRFVTIHGYEASFGSPYGHHNVYFRDRPGPLLAPQKMTLPELWGKLKAGEAITIPHHTGKFPKVTWEARGPEFRRNFEIYSAHGLSEAYDPAHPLAFEQSAFTSPSRSRKGVGDAQEAWIAGLTTSTIASSDDHRAHPGQPHWGLAAVRATGLTRPEIFDALHARRTYGTTGARILLDFTVNGTPMGGSAAADRAPEIRVAATGTAPIEWLEILRHSKGEKTFRVVRRIEPGKADVAFDWRDDGFSADAIYYVRLRQEGLVRDRVAQAWSSPVWVKRKANR